MPAQIGSKSKTSLQAEDDKIIKKYIDDAIKDINKIAPSNSHKIRKWAIVPDNNEVTPTMKLRRDLVIKNNEKVIEKMFS